MLEKSLNFTNQVFLKSQL